MTKILHILSQRPGRSGSGVFLKAMVREAARAGYNQHVVAAGPDTTSAAEVPPLQDDEFSGIFFPDPAAPFPVPGNSDVMPYPSTVFSQMSPEQVEQYLAHTEEVLRRVKEIYNPDIVHAHHLWMMTARAREVFADVPMVATAHNVGLRLSAKAPHLLPHVLGGIRACDTVCVLTSHSRKQTIEAYGVDSNKIEITGAGYRDDFFYYSDVSKSDQLKNLERRFQIRLPEAPLVSFVGRLSTAKGIPFLLRAVQKLKARAGTSQVVKDFKLVLIGAVGSGDDGAQMAELVAGLGEHVIHTGSQPEEAVADVLRCSDLFVLPSLFEGLPLVMLEAAASGCPCVLSELPTVRSWVPQQWYDTGLFELIPRLETTNVDIPVATDTNRFVEDLAAGIERQLNNSGGEGARQTLAELAKAHSWRSVFERYEQVYQELLVKQDRRAEAVGIDGVVSADK